MTQADGLEASPEFVVVEKPSWMRPMEVCSAGRRVPTEMATDMMRPAGTRAT